MEAALIGNRFFYIKKHRDHENNDIRHSIAEVNAIKVSYIIYSSGKFPQIGI